MERSCETRDGIKVYIDMNGMTMVVRYTFHMM